MPAGASPRTPEQGGTAKDSSPADSLMDATDPAASAGVPAPAGVPQSSAMGGAVADLHAMLLGELQREAGLDPQQVRT